MAFAKKKFASQLDESLLNSLKSIAEAEGRLFQSVLEDAVASYIEQRTSEKPRPRTIAHFRASVEKNRKLGELLAQ